MYAFRSQADIRPVLDSKSFAKYDKLYWWTQLSHFHIRSNSVE